MATRPLAIAGVAAWLAYAGIYALSFGLSGVPAAFALRAGVANALPDGLLAVAVVAMGRRGDAWWPRHLALGAGLVATATAMKLALLWLDLRWHGQPFELSPGIVAWQVFLSALIGVAVTATTQAWVAGRRLRENEAHAARADALRAQAEMAALRAQLNPHFLFNTLHSVLGMIGRDPATAEAAVERLGDMLHYAIRVHRDGVDWTRLAEETRFAETYLALEHLRLAGRLRVTQRVDPTTLDRIVPTFCLQPLVENAVRHGVAPRADGGCITIDVRPSAEGTCLSVENDAVGALDAVEEPGSGVGLRVLRNRLEALYRGTARLSAGPTASGGYRVDVVLPPAGPGGAEAA